MNFILESDQYTGLFLPEQVQELVGEPAWQLEESKRRLIDYYRQQAYQFVLPASIEYADAFLANSVADLDLQTFRLTDPYTGKMLAVRSDFTAQMVRIDAQLQIDQSQQTSTTTKTSTKEQVNRLCYGGELLHTNAAKGLRFRNPVQVGIELFGDGSISADIEVVRHLLASLDILGLSQVHLDLGHVGLLKPLLDEIDLSSPLSAQQKQVLFALIQAKNATELECLFDVLRVDALLKQVMLELMHCYGDISVLQRAEAVLAAYTNEAARQALAELRQFAECLESSLGSVELYFDLTELQGFSYHKGMIFSAILPGVARPVAIGGRYSGLSPQRSATGFHINLTHIVQLQEKEKSKA